MFSDGKRRTGAAVLFALALLYAAQGIPFGFATEYLPVALRRAGFSITAIAAVGYLQSPWQAKLLWAKTADDPRLRARSRGVLLALQLGLAAVVAGFAAFPMREAIGVWFALTFLAALFAATQDIFVDALAVRVLGEAERGLGNIAQVAGYRVGILIGGAALLLLAAHAGAPLAILACAAVIAIAGLGAWALRDPQTEPGPTSRPRARLGAIGALRHLVGPATWPVLAMAVTHKLGLHMAGVLIKPMVVDAKWTDDEIGIAVVTVGIVSALIGAAAGGWAHRVLPEPRALAASAALQTAACMPLLAASIAGAPHALTTAAIACEHFASGASTTVLFAALMSATRLSSAGVHYTALTSANVFSIGIGGVLGGIVGDGIGQTGAFGVALAVSLVPLALVSRWRAASAASAREA